LKINTFSLTPFSYLETAAAGLLKEGRLGANHSAMKLEGARAA